MMRVSNAFKVGDHVVAYRSGAYYGAVIESVESDGIYLVYRDPPEAAQCQLMRRVRGGSLRMIFAG
jgi:hypothetical protein